MTIVKTPAYNEINGTNFYKGTDEKVAHILNGLMGNKERIRVFYGYTEGEKAGIVWLEEHETMGYVGRTGGFYKIPLLVHNARSYGGGTILTNRILKIVNNRGKVLYQHPTYKKPELFVWEDDEPLTTEDGRILTHRVQTADDVIARFESEEKAHRWADWMMGDRFGK